MALKTFRPLTPVQRTKQTPALTEITKSTPEKSLVEVLRDAPADATTAAGSPPATSAAATSKNTASSTSSAASATSSAEGHRHRIRSEPHRPHRAPRVHGRREKLTSWRPSVLRSARKSSPARTSRRKSATPSRCSAIPLGTAIHNVEITRRPRRPDRPQRRPARHPQ